MGVFKHLLPWLQSDPLGGHRPTSALNELERNDTPTLVVLEDMHWADEASLDLLKFLGRRSGPKSIVKPGSVPPVPHLLVTSVRRRSRLHASVAT